MSLLPSTMKDIATVTTEPVADAISTVPVSMVAETGKITKPNHPCSNLIVSRNCHCSHAIV